MAEVEMCWRCPTPMAFVHGTWQCPRCRFKLGCCEGDPQTCTDFAPEQDAPEPARAWLLGGAPLAEPVLPAQDG